MPDNQVEREIQRQIRELRQQFEEAVRSFEKNETKTSLDASRGVILSIDGIFRALVSDYSNAFLINKLDLLPKAKAYLAQADAQSAAPDPDEHIRFLSDLDRLLAAIEKEKNHNYPHSWWGTTVIKKHGKKLAVAASLAVLIAGGLAIARAVHLQHQGLVGIYYSDMMLGKVYQQRLDHEVNFNWGTESPFPNWKKDKFSVRWTGFIKIPADGIYDFYTHSDDGVRLKIEETQLIDNWTVHHLTMNHAKMELKAGPHPITLEYYENKKRAVIKLFWKNESDPRPSIIPANRLAPAIQYAS